MTVYTIRELARTTRVGERSLRTWRQKGWLRPTCAVGTHERFSMAAFEAAAEASLDETQKAERKQRHLREITDRYINIRREPER